MGNKSNNYQAAHTYALRRMKKLASAEPRLLMRVNLVNLNMREAGVPTEIADEVCADIYGAAVRPALDKRVCVDTTRSDAQLIVLLVDGKRRFVPVELLAEKLRLANLRADWEETADTFTTKRRPDLKIVG